MGHPKAPEIIISIPHGAFSWESILAWDGGGGGGGSPAISVRVVSRFENIQMRILLRNACRQLKFSSLLTEGEIPPAAEQSLYIFLPLLLHSLSTSYYVMGTEKLVVSCRPGNSVDEESHCVSPSIVFPAARR